MYLAGIPRHGAKPEQAFRPLSHLLSDEIQTANAENGLVSLLYDEKVRERFGRNAFVPGNVDVQGFFPGHRAGSHQKAFDIFNVFRNVEGFLHPLTFNEFKETIRRSAEEHRMKLDEFRLTMENH